MTKKVHLKKRSFAFNKRMKEKTIIHVGNTPDGGRLENLSGYTV